MSGNAQIVSVSPIRSNTISTVLGSFTGAQWVFDRQGNFAVYATSSLVRSDLIPIRGRYTVQGNVLRFSGNARSVIGSTGQASAVLDGTITLQGGGGIGQATHVVSDYDIPGGKILLDPGLVGDAQHVDAASNLQGLQLEGETPPPRLRTERP